MGETEKWLTGIVVLLATGWGTYVMNTLRNHESRFIKLGEKLEMIERVRAEAAMKVAETLVRLEEKVEQLLSIAKNGNK